MNLPGKVVLITGGKRIGASVAAAVAAKGADVALTYHRSRVEAEATAAGVRALGRRALACRADLSQAADCEAAVQAAVAGLGRLDVLVHMASIYEAAPWASLTPAHLQRTFDVEVKSALACALAAVPHMRAAGAGRIVTFSDWLAVSERPRYPGFLRTTSPRRPSPASPRRWRSSSPGIDPGQRDRAGADPRASGSRSRGVGRRGEGDPAGAVGRRRGDREGGARPDRQRLRHGRNDPRGRRPAHTVKAPSRQTVS